MSASVCSLANFNPRSREGSDGAAHQQRCTHQAISIHAPAKGATRMSFSEKPYSSISIHAPAKGATTSAPKSSRKSRKINPRSREGSDRRSTSPRTSPNNFNPRSREGSDAGCRLVCRGRAGFQSTLPRRERPAYSVPRGHAASDFNPRSREGSDTATDRCHAGSSHFNPRSREGSDSKNHQDYSQ